MVVATIANLLQTEDVTRFCCEGDASLDPVSPASN